MIRGGCEMRYCDIGESWVRIDIVVSWRMRISLKWRFFIVFYGENYL